MEAFISFLVNTFQNTEEWHSWSATESIDVDKLCGHDDFNAFLYTLKEKGVRTLMSVKRFPESSFFVKARYDPKQQMFGIEYSNSFFTRELTEIERDTFLSKTLSQTYDVTWNMHFEPYDSICFEDDFIEYERLSKTFDTFDTAEYILKAGALRYVNDIIQLHKICCFKIQDAKIVGTRLCARVQLYCGVLYTNDFIRSRWTQTEDNYNDFLYSACDNAWTVATHDTEMEYGQIAYTLDSLETLIV